MFGKVKVKVKGKENSFKRTNVQLSAFQNALSCQLIDSSSPSRIKGSNVQYEYLSSNLVKEHLF